MLKVDEAKLALEAARAEAASIGKAVSVAVVDSAGVLVVLERVNDSARMTAVIAEGKAAAAALTERDSSALVGLATNYPAIAASLATRLGGRFVPVGGGVVIRKGGEAVGAIGVSGATAEEDEQIAKAGAAKIS